MMIATEYENPGPSREEIDATTEPLVLEFGTGWCGYCQSARPHIATAFGDFPDLMYRKVEDGPGRPLGRSFRVKLWPTLVVLRDGKEVSRVVRPESADAVRTALAALRKSAT